MYTNSAIPLIEIHGEDNLIINKEALNIIKSINQKICIVAVAGLYRTGKSSLLNWLINRNAGFTVGPSINRCTRGLWMWGTPLQGKLLTGEDCSIIILDTEGIGGVEGDAKYDARIFSLAILLCSTLVYNSLGSIDETAISNLSFIAQLSHHIRISSSSSSSDNNNNNNNKNDDSDDVDVSNFCKIFPSFVWVVRDFALQLVDDEGDIITPTQYLNNTLEQTSGYDKATLERNRIRNMLSAFFPDRKCVTLVRPISDENALQQVDLIPYDDLREDFRESMKELRHIVFDNLHPKSIDNKPLNGSMFAGLMTAYVSAINEGGVPTISSAWEGVSQQECLDAKEDSIKLYHTLISEVCPINESPFEEEYLRNCHKKCFDDSLTLYKQRSVGNTAKEIGEVLQKELLTIFNKQLEVNENNSNEYCTNLFIELYDQIIRPNLDISTSITSSSSSGINENIQQQQQQESNKNIHGVEYSSDILLFRNDWNNLTYEYEKRSKGPSRWKVFSTNCKSRLIDCYQIIISSVQIRYERQITELNSTVQQKSQNINKLEAENEILNQKIIKIEEIVKELEKENAILSSEVNSSKITSEELIKQKRIMERNYEEEKDLRVRYEGKNTVLSQRVKELEGVETQCFELRSEKDALDQKIVELKEEIEHILSEKKKRCIIS